MRSVSYDVVLNNGVLDIRVGMDRVGIGSACARRVTTTGYKSGTQRPPTNPSIGRKVALYAIFGLSPIQYPRYR